MSKVIVEGTLADYPANVPVPVKAFRLKADKEHHHNHHTLMPGDVVHLSKDQADAFKDKFDAVDGSPYKVQTDAEAKKAAEDAIAIQVKRDAVAKK